MAVSVPHLCRRGSKLCGRFESFCAGWLPLPPDGADTFAVRVSASFAAAGASRWRWDDGASARITSIPCLEVKMAEETSDEKEKNQTKLTKCFAIIKAHGPRKTHTQPMYVQQISFIFRWECCAESTAAAHVSHLLLLCANTSSKWQAAQQMARPRLDRNKSERPATDGHQCIERGHFEYVMKRWLYTLLAKQRSQSRRRNTRDLLWVGFASRRTSRWRATSIPSRALRSIGSDCQSAVSWFGNKSHRAVVPVKIRALVPDRKTPVSNSISYRAVDGGRTCLSGPSKIWSVSSLAERARRYGMSPMYFKQAWKAKMASWLNSSFDVNLRSRGSFRGSREWRHNSSWLPRRAAVNPLGTVFFCGGLRVRYSTDVFIWYFLLHVILWHFYF